MGFIYIHVIICNRDKKETDPSLLWFHSKTNNNGLAPLAEDLGTVQNNSTENLPK